MTFLEINDRAYVCTVDVGSPAERAGIIPQDCVQFACVVGGTLFEDLQNKPQRRRSSNNSTPATSPRGSIGRNNINGTSWEGERDEALLDARATKYALDCESKGMRTSHNELRDMLAGCTLPPRGDTIRTPPRTDKQRSSPTVHAVGSGLLSAQDDDFTVGSNPNSLLLVDSMGGMFEDCKIQGKVVSSRRVPLPDKNVARNMTLNMTNAARLAAVRCFEGESDEDDGGESSGVHNNNNNNKSSRNNSNPLLDTPATPVRGDNVIYSSSPRRSVGGGGAFVDDGVVVEQSLWPVVLVFRRTVQRKRLISPKSGGGWGSPGLSLKGSLFGIPSFRMDDECDRAAALIRQLAPSNEVSKKKGDSSVVPMDVFCSSETDGESVAPTVVPGEGDDIEASTIRGMIESAVGLGFVRLSKVVVGVSLQGGSGILISRLPDGTWSAPSAMGVYGLGVGLQFGLEVCDFVFIIQTQEGMEHFKQEGNFVVGGNIGAAVANCGREAYGAASLGGCIGTMPLDTHITPADYTSGSSGKKEKDKDNNKEIAPMVAYAKSQGLYFGVSVDGLKFFTRHDINARTYKFSMMSEMTARDILNGVVVPPPEAEDLYSALHSVEHIHEIIELPRPPEMLKRDSMNDWRFDRSIAASKGEIIDSHDRKSGNFPLFSFLLTLNQEESSRFSQFETKFKKFMYCGVSVQHLKPNSAPTRTGMTRREKRTLWLMLPEVGSLRLGFVSKLEENDADATVDDNTVASSVASSRADAHDFRTEGSNVKLSKKYSVSLTDITSLSQDPNETVRLSPDDATEHLRLLSINDVTGKSILILAKSNKEAEVLFCGLKLLLECETARLSVRGGVTLNNLGGKQGKGALSPTNARGGLPLRGNRRNTSEVGIVPRRGKEDLHDRSKYSSFGDPGTDSDESASQSKAVDTAKQSDGNILPAHTRQLPSSANSQRSREPQSPMYKLGKSVYTDIATNFSLPLPLDMCRVLFLDSMSPVNKSWEAGRSDTDFTYSEWQFSPGSVREIEQSSCSEYQLISRDSMVGAQRTVSYNRTRNRELVRLSETIVVEQDDMTAGLVFVVKDEMPRRGFQAKAIVQLHSFGNNTCEARIVTEIKPVGKNLSNQQAVHKAFILVLNEMKKRYGLEEKGLLAVFLDVHHTLPLYGGNSQQTNLAPPPRTSQGPGAPSSKGNSITSFKDVLSGRNKSLPRSKSPRSRTNSSAKPSITPPSILSTPRRPQHSQLRPSTPTMRTISSKTTPIIPKQSLSQQHDFNNNEFAELSNYDNSAPRNPVTVEVKPLPKIRLDLLPVPREEDEEEDSLISKMNDKQKRKSKHSRHRRKSRV